MNENGSEREAVESIRLRLGKEPIPQPPPELVDRWHAALAELPPPRPAPPVRLSRRPARWLLAVAGVAASAAAVLLALPGSNPASQPNIPLSEPPPMALDSRDARDLGELADPARMAACLVQVGAGDGRVLEGRRVDWRGRPGVRLVLGTAPGHYRMLVVSDDCGQGTGRLLDERSW